MKTKKMNLATLGVEEMNDVQMREVNGGIWQALLFQVAMELIDGSFFSDIQRGYNEAR